MLEAGIKGEQSVEVVYENTATAVGSGVLEVFGTPCMLALMEKTASESVAPYLEEGCGSVGTQVTISHVAATPIGMTVRCETELTEISDLADSENINTIYSSLEGFQRLMMKLV